MKKVNFKHVLASLMFTIAFLLTGAIVTTAQVSTTTTAGQQQQQAFSSTKKAFVSIQVAKQKLQAALPGLYTQLNVLTPDTPGFKQKNAEVLGYKIALSDLNQGKSVSEAYAAGLKVIEAGFNTSNAADLQAFRNIQKQLYSLLTTP